MQILVTSSRLWGPLSALSTWVPGRTGLGTVKLGECYFTTQGLHYSLQSEWMAEVAQRVRFKASGAQGWAVKVRSEGGEFRRPRRQKEKEEFWRKRRFSIQ